jgi:hypothetical protein
LGKGSPLSDYADPYCALEFHLPGGDAGWQDGGMANDAKSKKNPTAVALHRANAD